MYSVHTCIMQYFELYSPQYKAERIKLCLICYMAPHSNYVKKAFLEYIRSNTIDCDVNQDTYMYRYSARVYVVIKRISFCLSIKTDDHVCQWPRKTCSTTVYYFCEPLRKSPISTQSRKSSRCIHIFLLYTKLKDNHFKITLCFDFFQNLIWYNCMFLSITKFYLSCLQDKPLKLYDFCSFWL